MELSSPTQLLEVEPGIGITAWWGENRCPAGGVPQSWGTCRQAGGCQAVPADHRRCRAAPDHQCFPSLFLSSQSVLNFSRGGLRISSASVLFLTVVLSPRTSQAQASQKKIGQPCAPLLRALGKLWSQTFTRLASGISTLKFDGDLSIQRHGGAVPRTGQRRWRVRCPTPFPTPFGAASSSRPRPQQPSHPKQATATDMFRAGQSSASLS